MNDVVTKPEAKKTKQYFGRTYGSNAPSVYQQYFVPSVASPLASELINVAKVQQGEKILDVACGTGVIARLAAEHVGSTGTVAGTDLNAGMLAVARSATPEDVAIDWIEAPAADLPFPDETFDAVLCGLSLQFFPDKVAALREIRRVLVPRGRLVVNVPGRITPIFEALAEGMGKHIDPNLEGFVRQVFSLPDAPALQRLINQAGFSQASTHSSPQTLRLPKPEDFLWQYIRSTPLAAAIGQASDDRLAALERDVVERWQPFVDNDELVYRQDVVVAIARK